MHDDISKFGISRSQCIMKINKNIGDCYKLLNITLRKLEVHKFNTDFVKLSIKREVISVLF